MNPRPFTFVQLLLFACLGLTSCKETEGLKKQLSEETLKIKALHDEAANMDTQMIELRKSLPATVISEAMIKDYSAKLAVGVVSIENEITNVKATIVEADTQLAQAQKDLEALRAMTTR
jgi:uncharacterized coiled-coil DUF342 family protein